MYKKISARFPGRCAKCREAIRKGDLIYWEAGNKAVFHSLCFGSKTADEQVDETAASLTPSDSKQRDASESMKMDIAELKRLALDVLDGKRGELTPDNFYEAEKSLRGSSFSGYSKEQLREWLRSGYKAQALQNLQAESPPIRKRRKVKFSEEGELQVDLAVSGHDFPFIEWTKRESAPGLSVDVQMNFLAMVDAETVNAYTTWVARLLYTLTADGFDLDVNVFSTASQYVRGSASEAVGRLDIKVKQPGKTTDFNRWSVMFSPAGFRGLVFAARALQCSRLGRKLPSHYGKSVAKGWKVEFDPQARKLTIHTDPRAQHFPQEEMDLQVRGFLRKYN